MRGGGSLFCDELEELSVAVCVEGDSRELIKKTKPKPAQKPNTPSMHTGGVSLDSPES